VTLDDAIVLLFGGVLWTLMALPDIRYTLRRRASRKWPAVEGVIDTGLAGQAGLIRRVHFTYAYRVDGLAHTGRFYMLSNKESAEPLRHALVGKKTTVRYNPRRPSSSLLSDDHILGKRAMQGPSWSYF
jgi:hypothetical protein